MAYERETRRRPLDFIVKTTKPKTEIDTPEGLVKIGPYEPGDEIGILELFNHVFPVNRTLDEWNWEFRDHPVGHDTYVGRVADGRIMSQFTALTVRTKVWDRTLKFAQVIDSMVHPNCRGGLKRRGLFGLTLLAHSYHYGHLEEEAVQMGLPNPWAYRLGKQTLYYVPLTKTYAHTKNITPDSDLPELGDVKGLGNPFRAKMVDTFPAELPGLWEKVLDRHQVICIRDRAYLDWRYVNNPHWDYLFVETRTPDGDLCGFAIVRLNWLDNPELAVAEWFVDIDVEGASEGLIAAVERVGRKEGMTAVKCVLNHMAPESRAFEDRGYELTRTEFRLVAHTYAPEVVVEEDLNRFWYYTLGDFDVL